MASSRSLTAESPLSGFSHTYAHTQLSEISNLVMLSVAVPRGGLEALNTELSAHFELSFPATGHSVINDKSPLDSSLSSVTLLGLQMDQCLLIADQKTNDNASHSLVAKINSALNTVAYLSDQSDNYAVLDIQGPSMVMAMERICSLNLSELDTNTVSRTLVEHLQVIVQKQSHDQVRLFSPRSSANSFLHAVTTSLENVTFDNAVPDTALPTNNPR